MVEKTGEIDEEGLLRRVQFGDAGAAATAYETLVRHFSPRLLRYLAGKGLTSEERQDIAAETWLRAWRLIAAYQYRGIGLFPWLRRIADHVSQELFRHRYLGISLEETPEVRETLAAPDAADAEALAGADRREIRAAMRSLLAEAPADYGTIIEALFFAEFSTEEIMELCGWSRSKVYTTKHRALAWLRNHLVQQAGVGTAATWRGET